MNGLVKYVIGSAALLISGLQAKAAEELNIKGAKLGMSAQEVQALTKDRFTCGERDVTHPELLICVHPMGSSGYRSEPFADTYAGQNVNILRKLKDDKLIDVYVSHMDPSEFETTEKALIEKFGEPQRETSTVHNSYGAEFDDVKDTWTKNGGFMMFRKRCGRVNESCLSLTSEDYMHSLTKQAAEKARSDM